jgi:sugar O-acyltransferase (sialic acid O-acetyltransferase NeuD family)
LPERLAVFGAGGHAKVVIEAARAAGHEVIGVYDGDSAKVGREVLGVPVLGTEEEARTVSELFVVAIGDNRVREQVAKHLPERFASVVHPSAVLAESAKVAPGAMVMAGAVVQPDVLIDAHAIVNTSASVDHDDVLEPFSQVGPGAHLGGNVRVGRGAFVGLGASVIQGIHIGDYAVVGAGAAVVRPVPQDVTVAGVPARVLSQG